MILSSMTYKPPFNLTSKIFSLSQKIYLSLGSITGGMLEMAPVKLRRQNNIKTIQASLAIEGNTLNIEQVTDIFEGKRIIGAKKDIIEVRNAILVYENFDKLNPLSIRDLLSAHKILMKDLVEESGNWRVGGVGIFKGAKITHVAPPANRVPSLMKDLFEYLKRDIETPWLIKACIFHYELEFIHPFLDGNGRMGRLWQQLLLVKENAVFKYVCIEEMIKYSQEQYYRVLEACDQNGDSTIFIEYSLEQILIALEKYRDATSTVVKDPLSRLNYAQKKFQNHWFSRKEYNAVFKNISSATASRDLYLGLKQEILKMRGEKNQAKYQFIR